MKRLLYFLIFFNTTLFAQYTNTVYLDPTNSGDPSEDGSIDHPYDHITDLTIQGNTQYLLKRGTSMTSTSPISITGHNNVKFGAYGPGTELPSFTRTGNEVVYIRGCRLTVIDSLHLICPEGEDEFIVHISGGSTPHTNNTTISNCELQGGFQGVRSLPYSTRCDTINIINCEIHDQNSDGIFIDECHEIYIEGCHIYDVNNYWFVNVAGADGDCIHIVGNSNNYKVYNNVMDKSNTGKKFGFIYGGSTDEYVSGEVIGNTIIPPHNLDGSSAIYISSKQSRVTIARNRILGRATSTSYPGYTPGSICYIAADTVYFYYNTMDSLNNGGVFTYNISYVEFYNNTIVSPLSVNYQVNFSGVPHVECRNNLAAGDAAYDVIRFTGSTVQQSNNTQINSSNTSLYNSGLGIVDWESSDFHKTTNTNDGIDVGLTYDFDSVYVSNPPERGSCEYIDGGQSNNPPNINNQSFSTEENTGNGIQIGTIIATDPDQGQTLTYTIISGNTDNAFQVNPTTGELTVNNETALDYETNPEFSLTVQVQDNGVGSLSDQAVVTVDLIDTEESPIAAFSSNTITITAGEIINFQDESLNSPTNCIWQFDGGTPNISFDKNPIITYNTPGVYDVGLVVSNSIGYDMLIKSDYIEVQESSNPPIASFMSNTTIVTAGEEIYFQDESLNLPTNWIWQFEGGSPSTSFDENPIIDYNTPGIYNVKLVASNSNGYDILLKSEYIEVLTNNNPPIANFTSNSTFITAGEEIYFQDESLNLPSNWVWQFEGGSPSTSFNENPIITYITPGIYNVQLIVSNSNGNDQLLKTDYIEVLTNNNPPIASFSASTNIITAGESINFQDESLNFPTNWIWQFEEGSPSTSFVENPIINYNTPGIFNVKIVASNSNGYDILLKSDYIEVLPNNNPPIANFAANNTVVTAGNGIYFQDESLNFPTNWIWQFEGGYPGTSFDENPVIAYNTPGIYNVQLVASNTNGYDILLKSDYIEVLPNNNPPISNFAANNTTVTAGDNIYFQDESLNLPTTWKWELEGGTPNTSFDENPIIKYSTPGIYNVKLLASNSNGYDVILKSDFITVQTNNKPPLANFSANTTLVTAGESIYFQDGSLNMPNNWIWQFEGGTPSISFNENPVISYNSPGIYNVQLVASNSNGYDIVLKEDYVEVQENNNPPIANFTANTTFITSGESIYFQDKSLNLPTNWIWQFEGGTPSISFNENPVITYNEPGIYNVQLVASNPNGYDILLKTDYIEVFQEKKGEVINDSIIYNDDVKYALNLYPNPTYNYINISLPNTLSKKYTVRIYSLFGEIAKEIEFNTVPGYLTKKIDLSNLRNGTYILHLEGDQTIERQKFIKL